MREEGALTGINISGSRARRRAGGCLMPLFSHIYTHSHAQNMAQRRINTDWPATARHKRLNSPINRGQKKLLIYENWCVPDGEMHTEREREKWSCSVHFRATQKHCWARARRARPK